MYSPQVQKINYLKCLVSGSAAGHSYLKSDSHSPKKICFICFNESPLKLVKNAFYFISKALFVLEIFKFLSWPFGHVEKAALLEI